MKFLYAEENKLYLVSNPGGDVSLNDELNQKVIFLPFHL